MLFIATFDWIKSYYDTDEDETITTEVRLVEADSESQVKEAIIAITKSMNEPYFVSYWVNIGLITPVINAKDVLGLPKEE